ncbi:hypothetical protein RWE15_20995 [Virgibacillus halophilus]|uniref:Uncharacterized protein n=1 Tax=Tigheibacillus halophilus TaxID=361280 RepID=A0ABU5CAK2_9BACI|nr:hypothetical protein [Virgibacillus halophilus]
MHETKLYYVTVDNADIRENSLPDSGIEFEIAATDNDIKQLEDLFMKRKRFGDYATAYLNKPFNEWGADREREAYAEVIDKIYKKGLPIGYAKNEAKNR